MGVVRQPSWTSACWLGDGRARNFFRPFRLPPRRLCGVFACSSKAMRRARRTITWQGRRDGLGDYLPGNAPGGGGGNVETDGQVVPSASAGNVWRTCGDYRKNGSSETFGRDFALAPTAPMTAPGPSETGQSRLPLLFATAAIRANEDFLLTESGHVLNYPHRAVRSPGREMWR